jgi:RNA polymerase sigma-70 factor (ECF subfamily)
MSAGGTFDITTCLKRVQGQDEEAARQLVAHVHPLLLRIVRSHRPVRMAEEDLLQEILVKMFQKLEQYEVREGAPFEHWLSRVAVRTCLDALRAEKRRPETRWEDLSEGELRWLEFMVSEEAAVPEAAPEETRELVGRLLGQLSPEDRLVVSLMDLEQKSVAEVTQITGWNGPLVKIRAFRARRKLRSFAEKLFKDKSL